jgi:ketosteroid isomerase-like protein
MLGLKPTLLGVLCVAVLAGCSSLGGGVDDATAITTAATKWSDALVAHDVDALMALYSEDFSDADGNSKADMRDFLADIIDQGMLDDVEADMEDVVLTIDEDTARYDGIILTSAMGSVTVDLTFGREEDGWKIVSMFAN